MPPLRRAPRCPAHLSATCPPGAPCRQAQVRYAASQVYHDTPLFRGLLRLLERPPLPPRLPPPPRMPAPAASPRPYDVFGRAHRLSHTNPYQYHQPQLHRHSQYYYPPAAAAAMPAISSTVLPPPLSQALPKPGRGFRFCDFCRQVNHARRTHCMTCARPRKASAPDRVHKRRRKTPPRRARRQSRLLADVFPDHDLNVMQDGGHHDHDGPVASTPSAVSASALPPHVLHVVDAAHALNVVDPVILPQPPERRAWSPAWSPAAGAVYEQAASSSTCVATLSDATSESVHEEACLLGVDSGDVGSCQGVVKYGDGAWFEGVVHGVAVQPSEIQTPGLVHAYEHLFGSGASHTAMRKGTRQTGHETYQGFADKGEQHAVGEAQHDAGVFEAGALGPSVEDMLLNDLMMSDDERREAAERLLPDLTLSFLDGLLPSLA